MATLAAPGRNGSSDLASAVVSCSTTPLLLLDGDLRVLTASVSFCQSFDLSLGDVVGRTLFALGDGAWDDPTLRSLLKATASDAVEVDDYEMNLDLHDKGRRCLVLHARNLHYGHGEGVRILLSVSDVTEDRASQSHLLNLVREKSMLLQEMQHRVANSLQIIAGVILQSARKVESSETRSYLEDAHSRVMSMATLQRQLAASGLDDVNVRTYFTQLCDSLAASVIRDRDQIKLKVDADDVVVGADIAVSLGLVVTELVINALKHAFPGARKGTVTVAYRAGGDAWSLVVSDDGVGVPPGASSATGGLGASILQGLTHQLQAELSVRDNAPGTAVTVQHGSLAAPAGGAGPKATSFA